MTIFSTPPLYALGKSVGKHWLRNKLCTDPGPPFKLAVEQKCTAYLVQGNLTSNRSIGTKNRKVYYCFGFEIE